jgi:hypothetical protein
MNAVKALSWTVGVLASLAVPMALAAATKRLGPNDCPPLEGGLPWGAIMCALAGLAGVCVIAFKNANRTS